MRVHWRKEEWRFSYFWAGSFYTFFLACVTIGTNFLKCFAVRAMGNALQPQISDINVVSNLIWVRSRIRRQVRLRFTSSTWRYKMTTKWPRSHCVASQFSWSRIAPVSRRSLVRIPLLFSGFFLPIAWIVKFTAMITLHFHLQPQYQYEFSIYFAVYFIIDFVRKWLREQWWFRRLLHQGVGCVAS